MNFYKIDFTKAIANPNNVIIVGDFRITVLGSSLLRIEQKSGIEFLDAPTKSIWYRDFKEVNYSYKIDKHIVNIKIGKLYFNINLEDISNSYVLDKGNKVYFNNDFNLKGTTRTLDMSPEAVVHFDDTISGEHKEISLFDKSLLDNGVVSSNGMAIFDDSTSFILDENNLYKNNYLVHDFYIFYYPNRYEDAVRALYKLTGNTPLLPRFVFGNWWSRYYPYTDDEYLNLLDTFASKGIPLSVATIDMDWHYVDTINEFNINGELLKNETKYGNPSGWTGFTWNHHLFKDYKKFLSSIHDRNLSITLNLHPSCGIRWFEKDYEMFANAYNIDPKSKLFIPFDFTNKKFIQNYFNMLNQYENDGVDFWWIDWQQGSKSKIKSFDPLWGLNHFHYFDINKNNKRGIILSRYAGIGSHRYPLGFSGDTIQTWEVFKYVLSFTSRSSNIGYTFWSHDIGGHHAGNHDKELYIRWLQFAVYNPIMRLHSTSGQLYGKEPWNYGKETELIAIDLLKERVKNIPYLYSKMYENSFPNARCFIKPLYYVYPKDNKCYQFLEEYFLGDLLVAPIFTPANGGVAKQNIYLPKGKWIDINSYKYYEGKKVYELDAPITYCPVFLSSGGIFYQNRDAIDSNYPSSLVIKMNKGKGDTTIYEDDGVSKEARVTKTKITQHDDEANHMHTIVLTCNSIKNIKKRRYEIMLLREKVNKIESNINITFFNDRHFANIKFEQENKKKIILKVYYIDNESVFTENDIQDEIFLTNFDNNNYNANYCEIIKKLK